MSIKFKNKDHEKFYEQCLGRSGSQRSGIEIHHGHQQRDQEAH